MYDFQQGIYSKSYDNDELQYEKVSSQKLTKQIVTNLPIKAKNSFRGNDLPEGSIRGAGTNQSYFHSTIFGPALI